MCDRPRRFGNVRRVVALATWPVVVACSSLLACPTPDTTASSSELRASSAMVDASHYVDGAATFLKRVELPASNKAPAGAYVLASDVHGILAMAQERAVASTVTDDNLAGLADYLLTYAPRMNRPTVFQINAAGDTLIPWSEALDVLAIASAFWRKMTRVSGKLSVSFVVASAPATAEFRMEANDGKVVRSTTTNARLTNVYRGLWTYSVTKVGYKRIASIVNLVDEEADTVSCSLVPNNDNAAASPCVLLARSARDSSN